MNCNVRTIARFMFFACAMSLTGTRGLRSQAPETIKEALAKAGVKRDSSSLIDALGNPKPLIRGLAAMELADQYNTKAIPAIEHALSNETDAIQRLNMAAALNLLGDPFGTSALVAICDDSLLSDDLRLEAAERTLDIKNIRCAQAVKAILAKSEMPSLQSQALIYLTDARLPPNTVATSDTLFESGLRRALHSMDAETRRKSALCVGKFMISAMKKDIAAAILIEHDSSVKDALVLTQKQLSEKWPVPHSLRLCLRDEWASSEARPFSSCQADPHPGGADLVVRLGDNRLSIYAVSRVPHSSRLCLVR